MSPEAWVAAWYIAILVPIAGLMILEFAYYKRRHRGDQ